MTCAIIGTGVAVVGLNTWKKQLKWSHGSELKRNILIELHRLENSIESIRTPKLTQTIIDPNSNVDRNVQSYNSFAKRYKDEWSEIMEHRNALRSLLPEARATWGTGLRDILDNLENPLKTLNWAIYEQVESRNPNNDQETKSDLRKGSKERAEIIFRRHKNDTHRTSDVLAESIKEITKSVENYLESRKT